MKQNVGKMVFCLGNALLKMRNAISSHHGLTASQMAIMIFLLKKQGPIEIHPLDIQTEFSLTHQTVTGIVNRLASKGFLTTSKSLRDKRSTTISVTQKAIDMWVELDELSLQAESKLLERMTRSEQEEFVRLLEMAIQNVKGTH